MRVFNVCIFICLYVNVVLVQDIDSGLLGFYLLFFRVDWLRHQHWWTSLELLWIFFNPYKVKIKYTASSTLPVQKLNWHLDLTKQIGNCFVVVVPGFGWHLDRTWSSNRTLFFIFVSEGTQKFLTFDKGKDDQKAGVFSSGGEKQTMIWKI